MRTVDLHTHSTVSDGTYTPSELVDYALQKGLSAIALTDHETSEGVSEALIAAQGTSLELISGIEISSDFNGREVHVVGLFVDNTDKNYISVLGSLRKERENRNHLMIEKFASLGISMTYDELKSVSDSKILTRSHFAKLLMKKGIVKSVAEAFDRFLADGKPAYTKRTLPTCEESLSIISDAGGIAVLAHPYTYKLSSDNLTKLISHVSSIGFTAIECYYPTHTPSQTRHILDLAEKYSLLPSGGSDFHGSNKPNLDLGTGYGELSVSYDILEKLKGSVKNGKRLN